ncbi:hypothetical protein GLOTRDRAFT_140929 [Gloeophyllum trabeum ATCC 11539]|uniref:WW domain-containing protein n=1 Tax=Gloeophyllum trabeum (strain ATCC 11539 / FP-39264 / Madison 617) TaxID=670483 RepID=S7RBB0_GLOTA|nr:uncharacterized protein GLOTRDRAFT_140929 [Gloeophyllum trabeum ATCC 11539]EPQ51500.1 hypothetical protein GLOTRDRAFT_140929 [Gloeophyllum trabeum ATCC 11539]
MRPVLILFLKRWALWIKALSGRVLLKVLGWLRPLLQGFGNGRRGNGESKRRHESDPTDSPRAHDYEGDTPLYEQNVELAQLEFTDAQLEQARSLQVCPSGYASCSAVPPNLPSSPRDSSAPMASLSDKDHVTSSGTLADMPLDDSHAQKETLPPHIGLVRTKPEFVTAISTSRIARYNRGDKIRPRTEAYDFRIPVNKPQGVQAATDAIPGGWKAYVHPEGALYFFHADQRIFTEADVRDSDIRSFIDSCVCEIKSVLEVSGLERIPGSELALEVLEEPDADGNVHRTCGYYFVDVSLRSLFWLEEYDAASMLVEIEGETSEDHIRSELEARFWSHCEFFPEPRDVPDEYVKELMAILVHASIDGITSSASTYPYNYEDTLKMMDVIERLGFAGVVKGYSACVVSRLMAVFAHARFLDYHGQRGARLARNQSIYDYETTVEHSRSFVLLSYVLLYTPTRYLYMLEKMWVDKVVSLSSWTRFNEQLQQEWSNLLLTSTVMLTVDISFLAIQSVDVGSADAPLRCAAQLVIYISTLASAGSIILSLLLLRQVIVSRGESEMEEQYVYQLLSSHSGLETLSIMYSVPFGLLLWSMASFLLAFAFLCFSFDSTFAGNSLAVRLPIAAMWILVLSPLIWYFFAMGTLAEAWQWPWGLIKNALSGLRKERLLARRTDVNTRGPDV